MGLTAGCAVCHDHKFDPVTMKDFYALSAFFNNTTQGPRDGNVKDTPPILQVPMVDDRVRLAELDALRVDAARTIAARREAARPMFDSFIATADPAAIRAALPQDQPLLALPLDEGQTDKARASLQGQATELALTGKVAREPGPAGRSALILEGKAVTIPTAGDFEQDQPFTVRFWLRPPAIDSSYAVVARMDDAARFRGWDAWVEGRRVGMHLIHAWPDAALKVVADAQLPANAWTLVTIVYDGGGRADGVKIYYDGKPQTVRAQNDSFKRQSIKTAVPLTVGSRTPGSPAHGVGLTGLELHGRALSPAEVGGLSQADMLAEIAKLPAAERPKAAAGLYDWWLGTKDEAFVAATRKKTELDADIAALGRRGAIAHVMNEKPGMPRAHILDRGEYDRRKEEVTAGTPEALPPFPDELPRNRLGLARWLLLPEHPLTARVTVNRFWQEVFGTGLVRTAGDFGTSGELPSHPELLDWLAVDFRSHGWDVKRLFRLMLTSAAYRQAATTTPEKLVADRDNRLLSRGPRFRMDAEMIRDQALAASNLLVRKLGGPSVKPYQPEGVWEAVAMPESNTRTYKTDSGENVYRRSLYWFWKRSAPPASMDIFNAPSRETCTVKRERTNTPLQALVTLNDPQFVEAARILADRSIQTAGTDDARIDFIVKRVLSRPFAADELAIVKQSLSDLSAWYGGHPDEAQKLVAVGEAKATTADAAQLAAWTMLTNELMNLDEALCK